MENLWGSYEKYPETASCWRCQLILDLESVKFEWPIGDVDVYFGKVPGYECTRCGHQYFPETVLKALSESVDKELIPS